MNRRRKTLPFLGTGASRALTRAIGLATGVTSLLTFSCSGDDPDSSPPPSSAAETPVESNCQDGKDNDADGFIDCDDLDCRIAGGSCTLAPPLDRTVASTLTEIASFLYAGKDPLQQGADATAFDPKRIAVVQGKTVDGTGAPLGGVHVSILNHAEYGYTLTRPDGRFDLAVNGGARLVVKYEKAGFLTAERTTAPGWQRFGSAPVVGLVKVSDQATTVHSSDSAQTVEGDAVEQSGIGKHQAVIVFQPNTTATAVLPDGSTKDLDGFELRVTELPFETASPSAPTTGRYAPGGLPNEHGVHFGLDFSVKEADGLGAARLGFSKPVSFYVENFLKLPVGAPVPLGYFDRTTGQWQSVPGGRVVKIVDVTDGTAKLDIDGDGQANGASALSDVGVTDAELGELGKRYAAGTSLWRASVEHFSPYDAVFPVLPPPGATAPPATGSSVRPLDVPSRRGDILVEPRAAGQSIGITGTPYSLHYQSNRTLAYGPGHSIEIPLIVGDVPSGLKHVYAAVEIAGQLFDEFVDPGKDLKFDISWDDKDEFGRTVQGQQTAHVSVTYLYDGALGFGADFGSPGSTFTLRSSDLGVEIPDAALTATFDVPIGVWDAKGYNLGGFGIDVLHAYDPAHQTLYFGSGDQRSAQNIAFSVSEPAASFDLGTPDGLVVAPDGSVIVTDDQQFDQSAPGRILRVGTDGMTTVLAGPGASGAAADLDLGSPQGVAVKSDGTVIVADYLDNAIREIHQDGSTDTLVSELGSDSPVIKDTLDSLDGIALGPREELYIANGDEVRKLEGGNLTIFAGTGTSGDGGPATDAALLNVSALAVGPDGSVYISERGIENDATDGGHRVRKVTPDGSIHTIAGNGTPGFSGDGGSALAAQLNGPRGIALGPDGSLYIADQGNNRIRRVTPDGLIATVLGDGDAALEAGALAQKVKVDAPDGIAVGPNGKIYVAGQTKLFQMATGLPAMSASDTVLPSNDGLALFRFDSRGKHKATLDAMTGTILLSFAYDDHGFLSSISDKDGLATNVGRDTSGNPTEIVAPFGQKTTLTVQNDLLSVSDELGRQVKLEYSNGLLSSVTDPRGGKAQLGYDATGRLLDVTDPTGYKETYADADVSGGYGVNVSTPERRVTGYTVSQTGGVLARALVLPDGHSTEWDDARITRSETDPDGTVSASTFFADNQFGAQTLVPHDVLVTTPSGRTLTATMLRDKVATNVDDPLSVEEWHESLTVNNREYHSVYKRADKTATTTSPMGRSTMVTYDDHDRPTDVEVPGLASTHYDYDSSGRVKQITRIDGSESRTESFEYGSDGLVSTHTDGLAHVTKFTRDVVGRMKTVTLPDKNAIAWDFDQNDNVTSLTPPGRTAHQFAYDTDGLLTSTTPPSLGLSTASVLPIGASSYAYTDDRELSRIDRSDGRSLAFDYDDAGRPKSLSLENAKISFGYDASTGKPSYVNRSDSVRVDLSFDGPLWTKSTWSNAITGSVSAQYDANFWLESLTVNGASTVHFTYDDDGLLVGAHDVQGIEMTLSRDPQTGFVTDSALDAVSTAYAYNGFGELRSLSATFSTPFHQTIDRDALGRITHVAETSGNDSHDIRFTYDGTGRLVEVDRDGSITDYTYDANGNRLSVSVDGSVTESGDYDAQDRIKTYAGRTYETTDAGDVLRWADDTNITELSYDELGSLMKATVSDGTTTTTVGYVIDGMGRRVAKKKNGSFFKAWLYRDGLRPVSEVGSDKIFTHFVYLEDGAVAPDFMLRSGHPYRLVKDHLGSVRFVVDAATGDVVQELDYDEFGRVLEDTNPGFQPFGFAGGLYDPDTRLLRFGVRDYDAVTGRWTAKDPTGFAGGDANLYAYAASDPVNHIDRTGLDVWIEGPSSEEPEGHLSIVVGDPKSQAPAGYQFGTPDPNTAVALKGLSNRILGTKFASRGVVGDDMISGGDYYPGYYLRTTHAEDVVLIKYLESLVGRTAPYQCGSTCRDWAIRIFELIRKAGYGKAGPPPPKFIRPGNRSSDLTEGEEFLCPHQR